MANNPVPADPGFGHAFIDCTERDEAIKHARWMLDVGAETSGVLADAVVQYFGGDSDETEKAILATAWDEPIS